MAGNDSSSSNDSSSPLIAASQHGNVDELVRILEEGEPDSCRDASGATALWNAVWKGHTSCADALIKARADVNTSRADRTTPLYIAAQEGHAACVELLLAAGSVVDEPVDTEGLRPLIIAAERGHHVCLDRLLQCGANVNALNNGSTALWKASQHGHTRCACLLLEAGASVDLGVECSPLANACHMGHHSCAELLIRARAEIDLVSPRGATPLFLAVFTACVAHAPGDPVVADHPEIAGLADLTRYQLPHGDQMDAAGAVECVKLLVAAGASVDASTPNVDNALTIARQVATAAPGLLSGARAARCVALIIERGAAQLAAAPLAPPVGAAPGAEPIAKPGSQPPDRTPSEAGGEAANAPVAVHRVVRWAAGVASPEPTREAFHRRARTADLPIPWRDPVDVVKLRRAGVVSLEHVLDWVAMADVRAELRPPTSAEVGAATRQTVPNKRRGR